MSNQFDKKWSDEHIKWVQDNRHSYSSYEKLREDFNKHFNADATRNAIIGLLRKNGNNARLVRDNKVWWTEEMHEWLKSHYPDDPRSKTEIAVDFNKEFGTNVSGASLVSQCRKLKLYKNDYKGCIAYNTRRSGSFPIGSEYIDKTNGYTYVKVNNLEGKRGHRMFKENWKLKQRIIYEQHYGPIEKGYVVIFLDGNKNNFDINNLALVTSKEMLHLQTLNWMGKGEMTKAGIEVIRTEQTFVDAGIIKRQKYDINRLRNYRKK